MRSVPAGLQKDGTMATNKQLEANRANARRSTGPKSASGKARSRLNAVTHGLTARQIVVGAEKPEEFDAFREALFADLEPSGALQCELVDEIVRSMWRLRRIPVLEAGLLNRVTIRSGDLSRLTDEELDQFVKIYRKAIVNPEERQLSVAVDDEGLDSKTERLPRRVEMLSILSRYEASLIAGRHKALNLLYGLKAARAAAEDDARTVWTSPANGRFPKPQ
jgi:hypothetical protein